MVKMIAGIRRLRKEESGVSVVIGAILMLLILATLFGITQAYSVPRWNKDVEYEHFDVIYDDMMKFKSDVEDVALLETPKSSDFRMGVRYPNRIFLSNPGTGVAGSLTSENVAVSIAYTIDAFLEPVITTDYTSNRIIYEAHGSIDSPKLVYEHGLIIRDYGNEYATTDEQSLIIGDEIYLPILTGNLTAASSMETESISLRPKTHFYSRSKIKSVNITIDTAYPEVWEQLLAGTSTDDTTVSVNQMQSQIIIVSTAIDQIGFPTGEVTADALYAGLATLSTNFVPIQYSDIDITQDYPCIIDITIDTVTPTSCTLEATVRNVTAPFDIHADFTDLSNDPAMYDVFPDYASPDSTTDTSWNVPNENTVRWTAITHPRYLGGSAVIMSFTVYNTENNMKFFTSRIFMRANNNFWDEEL
ncbi:MAG: hypothetical protein PHV74_09005 [Dehalococcoidia bacterium]|nr:hypothetical protein [Dehalococcoidia bacterium]